MSSVRTRKSLTPQAVVCLQVGGGDGDDEPPEALDISWPSGARKRITYILLAPIVFPLWLTLPDTRCPRGTKSKHFTHFVTFLKCFSIIIRIPNHCFAKHSTSILPHSKYFLIITKPFKLVFRYILQFSRETPAYPKLTNHFYIL